MRSLEIVLASGSYDIIIEKGAIKHLGEVVEKHLKGRRAVVITDKNVRNIYLDKIEKSLEGRDFEWTILSVEPGETSKSLEVFEDISNHLVELGVDRNDLIIAFGGGVVGDLAGFIASVYLRGVPYIQVPTTLLSQIDSSVGGKTAINLPGGKNMIGSFYQPKEVLIDPELLITLEDRVFSDGLGEAIKYGCICDKKLFELLEKHNGIDNIMNVIEDIIYETCRIKSSIVQEDEKEASRRVLLNFGHTLGHAIERYYDYRKYSHGEAVGLGMVAITENTEAMGITAEGTATAIKSLLQKYDLPVEMDKKTYPDLVKLAYNDKKSMGKSIKLIVLEEVGTAKIITVTKEDLHKYLA